MQIVKREFILPVWLWVWFYIMIQTTYCQIFQIYYIIICECFDSKQIEPTSLLYFGYKAPKSSKQESRKQMTQNVLKEDFWKGLQS